MYWSPLPDGSLRTLAGAMRTRHHEGAAVDQLVANPRRGDEDGRYGPRPWPLHHVANPRRGDEDPTLGRGNW